MGRPSLPATNMCCAPACGTPASSGSRTASGRWRATCPASTRWSSMPSSARSGSGWSGWSRWRVGSCRICRVPTERRAERAALLAKADLRTGMVGEFPELQGIMGGHYARAQGEDEAVASSHCRALRAQGAGRSLPERACERSRGACRQARHAGRLLCRRHQSPRAPRIPSRFGVQRSASSGSFCENRLRLPLRARIQWRLSMAMTASGLPERGEQPIDGAAALLRRSPSEAVHLRGEGARPRSARAQSSVLRGSGEEDDLVRFCARVDARFDAFLGQRGRAQPAHGLSPRQQHRRDRGEEGQAALRGSARPGAAARARRAGAATRRCCRRWSASRRRWRPRIMRMR